MQIKTIKLFHAVTGANFITDETHEMTLINDSYIYLKHKTKKNRVAYTTLANVIYFTVAEEVAKADEKAKKEKK